MATPNQTTNRSVQSGSPAGAGDRNTGATGMGRNGSGPVDRSMLADALAKTFGGEFGSDENSQGQPRNENGAEGNGGTDNDVAGAEETQNEPGAGTAENAENAEGEESGRPLPEEGDEPEAGSESGDGDGNQDGSHSTDDVEVVPTDGQDDDAAGGDKVPKGVQKRIAQLVGKVRELEQKLQNQNPADGATARGDARPTSAPLDSVMDLTELERREAEAEAVLSDVDPLITRLAFAPQQVEQQLRKAGAKLVNEQGEDDFSVERMADVLLALKAKSQAILKAAPARRNWLQNHTRAHAQAVKVYPWLNDQTDERHSQVQQILQQFPGLKAAPNYEYWVACALQGHLATMSKVKGANGAKPNGGNSGATQRPTNGVRKGLPNSGAGGGGAPRVAPDVKKRADAKAKVLKTGTVEALSDFMEASGIAG